MTEKLPKECVLTLVIVFMAALIDGLDASIVTVSLPIMSKEMGVSIPEGSWFILAYVLGLAALLLPLGKMAKNGRVKKYMIFGTILFGASSVMCGLSNSFWMLVIFRLIQGIAAAMMSATLPSIIVHMLPVDRKGLGMSVMGASSGVAIIVGPVLGGFLTSAISWHWIFFINVPFCLLIVLLTMYHFPKDQPINREKDPSPLGGLSAMLLIGSVLTLLEDLGDPDINRIGRIICGIITVISLMMLLWSIRRDSNRAIIAPKMLMNRDFIIVTMSFLLCTIVVGGATYLLPFLLQGYWDMDASTCGLYLAAVSVAMMITVLPVGSMCDKYGCKVPVMIAVIMRGLFCIISIYLCIEHSDPIFILIPAICFGISHAFSGTAQPTRMIHHATPGYEDEATNFMLVVNYIADALGVVLFAMIFGFVTSEGMEEATGDLLADGFIATMWFSLIILALAMICTVAVKNKIVRTE